MERILSYFRFLSLNNTKCYHCSLCYTDNNRFTITNDFVKLSFCSQNCLCKELPMYTNKMNSVIDNSDTPSNQ